MKSHKALANGLCLFSLSVKMCQSLPVCVCVVGVCLLSTHREKIIACIFWAQLRLAHINAQVDSIRKPASQTFNWNNSFCGLATKLQTAKLCGLFCSFLNISTLLKRDRDGVRGIQSVDCTWCNLCFTNWLRLSHRLTAIILQLQSQGNILKEQQQQQKQQQRVRLTRELWGIWFSRFVR